MPKRKILRTVLFATASLIGCVVIFLGALAVYFSLTAIPRSCREGSPQQRLQVCTQIIQSGEIRARFWTIDASPKQLALAYNGRGIAYAQSGKTELSIADFNKAISLDPDYAELFNNRGNSYSVRAQLDRALADYESAIRLNPSYAVAYVNRGVVWNERGDFERAIADYNKALELDPGGAAVIANRGNAYARLGKFEKALADYDRVIGLGAKFPTLYLNRGLILANMGEFERAIEDYDKAIAFSPNLNIAFHYRGLTHLKAGQIQKAISDFEKSEDLGSFEPVVEVGPGMIAKMPLSEEPKEVWSLACEDATSDQRRFWQKNLKRLGYYTGPIDGNCSLAVVEAFRACAAAKCDF